MVKADKYCSTNATPTSDLTLTDFLFVDYCRVLNIPKPVILLIDKSVQVQVGFGTCYQFDMRSSWIAVSINLCVIRRFSQFSKFISHGHWIFHDRKYKSFLTLILLTWRIWLAPNNASRWQMGFKSVFKGLKIHCKVSLGLAIWVKCVWVNVVHLYKHFPILSQ